MKKRLYFYAVLTSPIIAIYGVSPLYVFDKISTDLFFIASGALTLNIFVTWLVNIYLLTRFYKRRKWILYTVSYSIVFLWQAPSLLSSPYAPLSRIVENFLIYPVTSTLAINTIILIICNSIIREHKRKDAEIVIAQLKVENLEAQKQVLVQQLHPHFLFNSLSVLKSLIKENVEDAEAYTVKLSEFLRYSVESHKKNVVTVAEELQFITDYLELQKARFGNSFTCDMPIPQEALVATLPVFSLQTLVENAFKHNYFTEKKPLSIRITCNADTITVWNNKLSINITATTQTGLKNLNKRYQLITGRSIAILETENDFSVTLPLRLT